MTEIERILTQLYQYGVERYKGQKKARVDEALKAIEQYVIKAKIDVAQKAPYLVIDGEVVSKHEYIAQLNQSLAQEE